MNQGTHIGATLNQKYKVECVRFIHPDGSVCKDPRRGTPASMCRENHRIDRIWVDEFLNLVVTAGRDKYLDATLKTGLTTPAWYVLLKNTGTVVAADTMSSHGGWTENTTYSNANRPTWVAGTVSAGSIDNSANKAAFNINGTTTIFGAGMTDNNTKGGTSGTLLGAGDFAASRSVADGDTLNVTVTCSLTAS